MKRPPHPVALFLLLTAATITCPAQSTPGEGSGEADGLAAARERFQRPESIPYPLTNPYSAAKAELGRQLFFDPRLSRDNDISCASCHRPELGWEDGLPVAVGSEQQEHHRHTQTIQNIAWQRALLWDGRTPTLESQVWFPLTAQNEMAQDVRELTRELAAVPKYAAAFEQIFPERGISLITVSAAIATFERGVVSGNTPFDRWVAGEEDAISPQARRGFALFTGRAHCDRCHSGWNFSDGQFHDTGLPASEDLGRYRFTRDDGDRHAFKTPGLRDIGRRAPYMHDGSLPTLRAVLAHYNGGFVERPSLAPELRELALSEDDIDALLAFLGSLQSEAALSLPATSAPDPG